MKIKEPRKSNLGFRRLGIKVSEDYHFDPETENEPKPSMSGIHFSSGSYRLHKGFDRPAEVKPFGYKRDILFGVKTEKANLLHAPSGKVVGKTNKVTFKDGSVRYFTDEELSTGHLKDF